MILHNLVQKTEGGGLSDLFNEAKITLISQLDSASKNKTKPTDSISCELRPKIPKEKKKVCNLNPAIYKKRITYHSQVGFIPVILC